MTPLANGGRAPLRTEVPNTMGFDLHLDNVYAYVGTGGYTAASGVINLGVNADGSGSGAGARFGSPSSGNPIRITLVQTAQRNLDDPSMAHRTVYKATGITGDQLTGVTLVEGTDRNYAAGDFCDHNFTKYDLTDIESAITGSSESITNGGGLTMSPSPLVGAGTIALGDGVNVFWDGTHNAFGVGQNAPLTTQLASLALANGNVAIYGQSHSSSLAAPTAQFHNGTGVTASVNLPTAGPIRSIFCGDLSAAGGGDWAGLGFKLNASQTADAIHVEASNNAMLFTVDSGGNIVSNANATLLGTLSAANTQFTVNSSGGITSFYGFVAGSQVIDGVGLITGGNASDEATWRLKGTVASRIRTAFELVMPAANWGPSAFPAAAELSIYGEGDGSAAYSRANWGWQSYEQGTYAFCLESGGTAQVMRPISLGMSDHLNSVARRAILIADGNSQPKGASDTWSMGAVVIGESAGYPSEIIGGSFNYSPIDALILHPPTMDSGAGNGHNDSHGFLLVGNAYNGSSHKSYWRHRVNMTANDGTGAVYIVEQKLDGASYATAWSCSTTVFSVGAAASPKQLANFGLLISTVAATPTKTAGSGAGTTPTITIGGTDTATTVSVTVGTTPSGSNANIVTVNYNVAFPNAPVVVLTPSNANAAALSGTTGVYVTSSTSGFTIVSGSTALTNGTVYTWNVHSIGTQ
jgi:hypothetical protein